MSGQPATDQAFRIVVEPRRIGVAGQGDLLADELRDLRALGPARLPVVFPARWGRCCRTPDRSHSLSPTNALRPRRTIETSGTPTMTGKATQPHRRRSARERADARVRLHHGRREGQAPRVDGDEQRQTRPGLIKMERSGARGPHRRPHRRAPREGSIAHVHTVAHRRWRVRRFTRRSRPRCGRLRSPSRWRVAHRSVRGLRKSHRDPRGQNLPRPRPRISPMWITRVPPSANPVPDARPGDCTHHLPPARIR